MNWTARDWQKSVSWFKKRDGSRFKDGREVKAEFVRLLGEGWKVLPVGDCDNFDKAKGCRGHEEL